MSYSIPIIEILKLHNANLNDKNVPNLPSETPYGNLILCWSEIQQRFDNINDLIIELQEVFKITKIKSTDMSIEAAISPYFYKAKFVTEQIFYWLRKSADDLISMLYILDYERLNQQFPEKINIESVSNLLIRDPNFYPNFVAKHKTLLNMLNSVSNAYKHSFINSQVTAYHGRDYPIAFAYHLKQNNTKNDPHFYTVTVSDFISDYCLFLKDIKDLIYHFEDED